VNTVNAVTLACASVCLVFFTVGLHSLQASLERWDYDRHFDD